MAFIHLSVHPYTYPHPVYDPHCTQIYVVPLPLELLYYRPLRRVQNLTRKSLHQIHVHDLKFRPRFFSSSGNPVINQMTDKTLQGFSPLLFFFFFFDSEDRKPESCLDLLRIISEIGMLCVYLPSCPNVQMQEYYFRWKNQDTQDTQSF